MIRIIYIISLVFLSCSYKSETVTKEKEFKNVIMTYRDPVLVGCGNLALAYRFKFRNLDNGGNITCIIRCPDTYGEGFFEEGKRYEVKLSNININDSIKGYSMVNNFENDNDSVYLVTIIKRASAKIKNTE